MDDFTKDLSRNAIQAALYTALTTEVQEQSVFSQIRIATASRIVEKVLSSGTAADAVELLKQLDTAEAAKEKLKTWQSLIDKVEKLNEKEDS